MQPSAPQPDAPSLEEDPSEASEAPEPIAAVVRAAAPLTDPLFAPAIAPVNEHVDFLRKLRPGFEVPYVDPMHSAEECRIVSLFSNTGEANPRGFVWAGDDAAATRLLGLQYQLGLRPEWTVPWNAYPWFTPGEANGKLTPEQVQAGLKPLLALLKLLPRASAIVAHGPEANRLAQQLLKTGNPLIWRRGLKVYKARSLHGRAFAGSKERQTEWLIEMGTAYADAMARAGVQLRRA
ncbi:uracil-DNA glycosylase [Sinomonas sp. G460-2]|uniref:uracil-DNA glycosylase n=1 Tax=Sinomonas sp. G460-2 TaxID=3393464 RepID=UPI0039EED361